MRPTKFSSHEFPRLVLIALLGSLFLCSQCPPRTPAPNPGGGGATGITLSGTVKEQFNAPAPAVVNPGAIMLYASNTFSQSAVTNTTGMFNPDETLNGLWDGTSALNIECYFPFNGGNVIDKHTYNLMGSSPFSDLKDSVFLLTPPAATVPVTVVAQKFNHEARTMLQVQITDPAPGTHVYATGTTGADGSATFAAVCDQNKNYAVLVTSTGIKYPFNTFPMNGSTGTLCNLRTYIRY